MKERNPKALLPIAVFLVMYLGTGLIFEYVIKIPEGFYKIPIIIAFLVSILVGCLQNKDISLDDKLAIMGKGIGDQNIITMLLIFLTAGAFVGVVGQSGARSVAYFMLSFIPGKFATAVLFLVSCFISTAMGTSVGTITLIVPIAINVASASGFPAALCIASVIGGAMFGDNLSFISDITIAACNGQGCDMREKFKENLKVALPAALVSLAILIGISLLYDIHTIETESYSLVQIIPYVLVFIGGILGINVFVVLLVGIVSGSVISLACGSVTGIDLLHSMGQGSAAMFETCLVAILVSAMCALIRERGGFDALLYFIKKTFKGRKSGQLGMGILVGIMDIATANNTVAVVMANPIAKEMREEYQISSAKTATILVTFACIFQGIIPYGAQMLVAVSSSAKLGVSVSSFDIMSYLIYPYMLFVFSVISIFGCSRKKVSPSRS